MRLGPSAKLIREIEIGPECLCHCSCFDHRSVRLWSVAKKLVEDMKSSENTFTAEVAVVGGGPAGLVSAIALAAGGVDTLLIARPTEDDHRTTALLAGSVTALQTLGVWQACEAHAAPLRQIRIVDDTRRLIRAPE